MEYALRDFIDVSNHTVLTEVKNEAGEVVSYKPEIHMQVDWFNADETIRKLFSCQVIFYALRHNQEFRIKWNSAKDINESGPASIKSHGGYATFTRTGTQPQMMELVYAYSSKALEVKEWEVGKAKEILNLMDDNK